MLVQFSSRFLNESEHAPEESRGERGEFIVYPKERDKRLRSFFKHQEYSLILDDSIDIVPQNVQNS